jgi:dolichyl-phosphate-mannose--protein O-mannosyl transferase
VTPAATDITVSPATAGDDTGDGERRAAPPRSSIPRIVRRRLAPFDARLDVYSWLATGLVVFIAAVLRLVGLNRPKGIMFDETYYATDAWDMLTHGVEWDEKTNGPAYVVHPPLGKWLIAVGEKLFGYNEFGWRVAAALAGTLSVLIVVRIARRMFHSTTLGCAAGLLIALDGFHLVLSRAALLDIFLLLFVVAAFGALVMDREQRRRRWLAALQEAAEHGGRVRPRRDWRTGVPWWRLFAAVLAGCALSVKWSAIFHIVLFGVLILIWEVGARRSAGVRRPIRDTFLDEIGWLLLSGVLITATYVASWAGWLLTDDGYFRHFRRDMGLSELPVIGALQNLWHYHQEALKFHSGLVTAHQYQSEPWQWLLLGRPVAFFYNGDLPCGASQCSSEVLLLGTPLLWWSFIPALAALVWLGIARRDWRAWAILLAAAAGILPWFYFALADNRTMFYFYAAPAEPFLVMAVVYVLGAIVTPPAGVPQTADRRLVGAIVVGAYVLLVAVCFAYFHPLYVGTSIPYTDWGRHLWLDGRWR